MDSERGRRLLIALLSCRQVVIMDISGSMCRHGGNCRHEKDSEASPCSMLGRMREGVSVLLRPGGELSTKDWFDIVAFNHGAARWGGKGGTKGREFVEDCSTEKWLGR